MGSGALPTLGGKDTVSGHLRPRYAADARRRRAVELLVRGLSQEEAAEALEVTARTVRRYLAEPTFRVALAEAQDEALGRVARRMTAGASEMLDVLESVACDGGMPPTVRVRAALGWLAQLWRAKELQELAERVRALEEALGPPEEVETGGWTWGLSRG